MEKGRKLNKLKISIVIIIVVLMIAVTAFGRYIYNSVTTKITNKIKLTAKLTYAESPECFFMINFFKALFMLFSPFI